MRGQGEKELPDRKRLDEGSDLAAVKGQHQEHEGVIEKGSGHSGLPPLRHRWTTDARVEYCLGMKYVMLLLWLFMASSVQAEVFPTSLGGIVLGEDISSVHGKCEMHTKIPLSQERHLVEIQLRPYYAPGIKSGAVAYANCDQVGKIVRIKLKFENDTREFFDDLLERYRDRFGRPLEWRGDPFQTVMSWKWSFHDNRGRQVNLELTHSQDEGYKTGNFVKMTLRSLWVSENECLEKKYAENARKSAQPTPDHLLDYRLLIPR
jgi:hypothetical protein